MTLCASCGRLLPSDAGRAVTLDGHAVRVCTQYCMDTLLAGFVYMPALRGASS